MLKGSARITEKDVKILCGDPACPPEADVNYKVVKDFTKWKGLSAGEVMESLTPGQQVIKIVHENY